MGKVVLCLLDGLRYDTAVKNMGFLEACVQEGKASRRKMTCCLPSLSRPLYESIHTGVTPLQHGILLNEDRRPSSMPNVFALAHAAGKVTAAAAYSWFAELYSQNPYDPVLGREVNDPQSVINHGRYYTEDSYPDIELARDADMLLRRYEPDYLLYHPMGSDHIGHSKGGESDAYATHATVADMILSAIVPGWIAAGYDVLVTADHGMNAAGMHGGNSEDVTTVPWYHVGAKQTGIISGEFSQLSAAPTILTLLGLDPDSGMQGEILL